MKNVGLISLTEKKDFQAKLVERLREIREMLGFTKTAFRMCFIPNYNYIEYADGEPKVVYLWSLANFLDIPFDEVIGRAALSDVSLAKIRERAIELCFTDETPEAIRRLIEYDQREERQSS